jgi:flagellar hook-length control protein FliK
MAAGGTGPAAGKQLVAALRPEPPPVSAPAIARTTRSGGKGAGDDLRPPGARTQAQAGPPARGEQRPSAKDAAGRRDDAASAAHEAAASADSRAQARAQAAADAADKRSDFSAALDKARAPSQAPAQARPAQAGAPDAGQAAVRQAVQATEACAGATAAEAASLAMQAGSDGTAPDSIAATLERKPPDTGPAGDSLEAANAAVASLLGWLQPVLPVPGQQSAAHGGGGSDAREGSQGAGIDGIGGVEATGLVAAGAGNGSGTQAGTLPAVASAGAPSHGNAPDVQALAGASGNASAAASAAAALAGKADDPSAGALAYATRYGEAKAATPATAGGQAAQPPGFDASQSLRSSAAAMAAPAERSVPAPMGDRHWARALSTQVLLLANHKVESATLRLSPEHTGPIEVRIQLQDSGVSLAFNATQPDTRAALEQALPQLRAAFAGAGLALGQATVGQQMRQGSQFSHGAPNGTGTPADHPEVTAAVMRPLGLLDEYA